ncbi:MAG: SPASM domain-containing protein, partial [Prosthecochloris sp.]|uniref:SPASM domain-containing protein n=1 Tax=Prosthecochloris sp. TaxID=290513 RepID=UPI0025865E66
YKCWEDVGCSPEIVGNVNDSNPVTNHDVLARYSVAADPFLNASCVACRFLPICTEACPKKRVQNQSIPTTEKANNICTHFKDYLIGYMEIAYDIFTTSQQCRALLSKPTRPLSQKGFRVIFPARETSID